MIEGLGYPPRTLEMADVASLRNPPSQGVSAGLRRAKEVMKKNLAVARIHRSTPRLKGGEMQNEHQAESNNGVRDIDDPCERGRRSHA
jgi:hypothetical protein